MNQWFENNLPPLILAIMGGLADYLTSDEHSWATMLISLFLAGFCGYMTLLLCQEWGMSQAWTGVSCGLSGLGSKSLIKIMKRAGINRIAAMLNGKDVK